MTKGQRVLVAVDGSEPSLRALDTGVRLATAFGTTLELVAVLDVAAHEAFGNLYMSDEKYAQMEQWIKKEVLAVAHERVPSGGPHCSLRVVRGHPVQVLLGEAERGDVEFICVGRTGKGALQKVLEGSVSRRLAKMSPVPIVVVG